MKNMFLTLRFPVIIGLIFVFPFMLLEFVNRRGFQEGFPATLFGLLWLLPVIFIVTVLPMVRTIRAGNSVTAKPLSLLMRIVTLVIITGLWAGILIDQLPCFLGALNCD